MLTLPKHAYDALRRHGEEAYPEESCGVLVGTVAGAGRLVATALPCANACADARRERYAIDAGDLFRALREARARGLEIVGFYHSHPDHPARPSPTDLAEAYWPGHSYVISRVAGGRAEATASFVLRDGGGAGKSFEEEEVRVT